MKWYVYLIFAIGCLVAGGLSGWTVHKWYSGYQQAGYLKADRESMKKSISDMLTKSQQEADRRKELNDQTAKILSDANKSIGDQRREFKNIFKDIYTVDQGICDFTPAASGLWMRAYEAAVMPGSSGDNSAGPSGEASGPDAVHRQAKPAAGLHQAAKEAAGSSGH